MTKDEWKEFIDEKKHLQPLTKEQWADFATTYFPNTIHVTPEGLAYVKRPQYNEDGEDVPMTEQGFKDLMNHSKACEENFVYDLEEYLKSQREINKKIVEGVKPFLTEEQFNKFKAQYE